MAINFTSQIHSLYAANVASEAAYQSPGTYNIPTAGTGGSITGISVGNAGSGYTSVPTVGFTGGGGSGAAATAVLTPTTVASFTGITAGTGYTSIPTVTISGGGGSGATATARMKALTVAIQAGGTGYAVNDTITLTGGTSSQAVILTVATVNTGVITGVTITDAGNYSVLPSNPVSQGSTSGTGTGATFNITSWGLQALTLGAAGSGFTSVPTVSFSGGAGTGAAATATVSNAEETKILTLIEVIRAYFAETNSAAEAKAAHELLVRMLAKIPGGGGTYSGSTLASRMQAAGCRLYAGQNRPDY